MFKVERFKELLTDPHKHGLISTFDIQRFKNVFTTTNLSRNKRVWVEKRVTELQWDCNSCFIIWHAAKQFIVLGCEPPPPTTTNHLQRSFLSVLHAYGCERFGF